jgi:hypothetical protein
MSVLVQVYGPNWYKYEDTFHQVDSLTNYTLDIQTCKKYGFLESLLCCVEKKLNQGPVIRLDDTQLIPKGSGLWHCVMHVLTDSSTSTEIFIPDSYLRNFPHSLLLCFYHVFEKWTLSPCPMLVRQVCESLASWNKATSFDLGNLFFDLNRFSETIQAMALVLKLRHMYELGDSPPGVETMEKETKQGTKQEEVESKEQKLSIVDPLTIYMYLFESLIQKFVRKWVRKSKHSRDFDLLVLGLTYRLKKYDYQLSLTSNDKLIVKWLHSVVSTINVENTSCWRRVVGSGQLLSMSTPFSHMMSRLQELSSGILPDALALTCPSTSTSASGSSSTTTCTSPCTSTCTCGCDVSFKHVIPWMSNVVLAGSTMLYLLNQTDKLPSDIDLFILNHDEETLQRLISCLFQRAQEFNSRMIIVHYAHVYTLVFTEQKCRIQIILSRERTPWELIRHFDLDYIKMFYSGQECAYLYPECYYALQSKSISFGGHTIKKFRMEKATHVGFRIDSLFMKSEMSVALQPQKVEEFVDELSDEPSDVPSDKPSDLHSSTPDIFPEWKQPIAFESLRTFEMENEKAKRLRLQSMYGWFYPTPEMSNDQVRFLFEQGFQHSKVYFSHVEFCEANGYTVKSLEEKSATPRWKKSFALGWDYQPHPKLNKRIHILDGSGSKNVNDLQDSVDELFLDKKQMEFSEHKGKHWTFLQLPSAVYCNIEGEVIFFDDGKMGVKIRNPNHHMIVEGMCRQLINRMKEVYKNRHPELDFNHLEWDIETPTRTVYGSKERYFTARIKNKTNITSWLQGWKEGISMDQDRKGESRVGAKRKRKFPEYEKDWSRKYVCLQGQFTNVHIDNDQKGKSSSPQKIHGYFNFEVNELHIYHNLEQKQLMDPRTSVEMLLIQASDV